MGLVEGAIYADRYRLEARLGAGGVGLVWAAKHVVTGKRVALKLLREEALGDAQARQRFVREARAVCAVRHPNVIQVHDVLEPKDAAPGIVMDLLDGETLGAKLDREGRVPLGTLIEILRPVCRAVRAAHELGIVHRDLKPENIFLCTDGPASEAVRVLDFGLAKMTFPEGPAMRTAALTGTGALLGTPYYMSPEQIFGEKDVDHRSDVWSLGIVIHECLTGKRPTEAANVGQVFKRITTGDLPRLTEVLPDVPEEISNLVSRMLSVDRACRPSDLADVAALLELYVSGAAGVVVGETPRDSTSAGSGRDTASAWTRAAPAVSRRAALAFGLAALVGALLLTWQIALRAFSRNEVAPLKAPASAASPRPSVVAAHAGADSHPPLEAASASASRDTLSVPAPVPSRPAVPSTKPRVKVSEPAARASSARGPSPPRPDLFGDPN